MIFMIFRVFAIIDNIKINLAFAIISRSCRLVLEPTPTNLNKFPISIVKILSLYASCQMYIPGDSPERYIS